MAGESVQKMVTVCFIPYYLLFLNDKCKLAGAKHGCKNDRAQKGGWKTPYAKMGFANCGDTPFWDDSSKIVPAAGHIGI